MKWIDRIKNIKIEVLYRYCIAKYTNILDRLINTFEHKYEKMQSFLEPNKIDKCIYKDLTPVENYKDNQVYIESLDWALYNNNILNIALTGPYGSGKSSILKTYKTYRPHYYYLNLSVATFHAYVDSQTNSKNRDGEEELINEENRKIKESDENEIEKRILQQLFYRIDSKKASFSRFRKVNYITPLAIIKSISLIFATICLAAILLFPEICINLWSNLSQNFVTLKENNISVTVQIIGYLLLVIFLGKLIISIFMIAYKSIKLIRFKIKDLDVEMNSDNNDSIFNRYIDEILYLFEVNPYDVCEW